MKLDFEQHDDGSLTVWGPSKYLISTGSTLNFTLELKEEREDVDGYWLRTIKIEISAAEELDADA